MRKYILLLVSLFAAAPTFVFAITLNLTYPKFGIFDLNTNQSLPEIVGYFYYFMVGVSGLAAFVMLVWGGVQWLLSGAIPSQASDSRDKIRNAILGLLLILASFLIIQVINPELTILNGSALTDPCSNPANAAKCAGALGTQDPGIFLCDELDCKGKYIYIDPSVAGCAEIPDFTNINLALCDPQSKSTAGTSDWNDKTVAIKFNPSMWNVVLFEDIQTAGWGRAICWENSVGDLGAYVMDLVGAVNNPIEWDGQASAMRVVAAGQCKTNGITLSGEAEAPPSSTQPVAFLFNVLDFMRASGRWATGLPFQSFAQGEAAPPFLNEYGVSPPLDVRSIWVEGASKCPSFSTDDCAVIVSDDAIILPASTLICFTSSVADTKEKDPMNGKYKYSFKCDGSTSISNTISTLVVTSTDGVAGAPEACASPGVVINCKP